MSARGPRSRLRDVPIGRLAGKAWRRGSRQIAGEMRARRLRRRPPAASPTEVRAALGGELEAALRGPAATALPTVTEFGGSLGRLDADARKHLLARAEEICAHRFELLGAGPADLGDPIDWSVDFGSGRRWPLDHRSRIVAFLPDGSDYKVPWELSRCQHLPLLSAAYRVTGEHRFLAELGAQLSSWIEANPVEFGVNWTCTMDVAIRASNWIAALVLAPESAREPWAGRVAESLLLHGRFIRANLETATARTNHYLSDIVGLAVVGALFDGGAEGRAWLDFAIAEMVAEMDHEVREDGCDHEASIPYHRLVCELFVCGARLADGLRPGVLPAEFRRRLDSMLEFVAAYTRPDGLAPQVGDADDGRFLPLGEYGNEDFRSHLHLFDQIGRPRPAPGGSAAFPAGGYFVMRDGDLYALVRCGDTGVYGGGNHAHNDQLSFELCLGERPLIIDPGTFTYYRDPDLRLRFRSTAFHSTLQVDGAEQNPLPPYPRFPLGDRSRAELVAWEDRAERIVFVGRHHGFETLATPVTHERRLELDRGERTLIVSDTVTGDARHGLDWTFPLGDCDAIEVDGSRATVIFGHHRLVILAEGAELRVEDGLYSAHYGVKEERAFLRARKTAAAGTDVTRFTLRVR
jgi:Heparinase II/III-like protein/Heparinase II/III N-terminus